MKEVLDVDALKKQIDAFAKEREWEQFHNPKNLAMALNVEAAELTEIFQWLTLEQSQELSGNPHELKKVKEELADIVVYAVRLCGILNIDLPQSIAEKMVQNEKKYPVEKARGVAKKYNQL